MRLYVSREALIRTIKVEVGDTRRVSLHDRPVPPVPAIYPSMQGVLTVVVVRRNVEYIGAVGLRLLGDRN